VDVSPEDAGVSVNTFSDLDDDSWISDIVVVPELENGLPIMTSTTKSRIREHVSDGGVYVIAGGSRQHEWVNDVFEVSLSRSYVYSYTGDYNKTSASMFSAFAAAPGSLSYMNKVHAWEESSLPAGAEVIYSTGDSVTVVVIPTGLGFVVLLGWDWYDSLSPSDSGHEWNVVLWSAMQVRGEAPFRAFPPPSAAMTAKLTRIGNTTSVDSGDGNRRDNAN
jgi:hypothetical protein